MLQSQYPPWMIGCPYPTPAQTALQGEIKGLGLLFLVLVDLAMGPCIALPFLASTRGDIPDGTRRSLFLFATAFLVVWSLVGTYYLSSTISNLLRWIGYR